MVRFNTNSSDETAQVGEMLAARLHAGDVIALTGELGAGKTRFTQGVARALGVQENVASPTFNLLLIHHGTDLVLNHWDLYRLDRACDLIDIDYFDQIASDAISLIEWGDKFAEAMIDADLEISFSRQGDCERLIEVVARSERGRELTAALAADLAIDEAWYE